MMANIGQDQYLPDDIDETMGFSQSAGADIEQQQQYQQKETQGGGNGVIMSEQSELNETQKLQLAERANEIYRQQLKYMQDHLASLRSLIQDKENIIENLMLRYDLGIITQDQNRTGGNLGPDEIEMEELRRKAEALAQRTILENFELREMVNELRDENFHLRNEIYELQDKINRQVLQINKLEKSVQQNVDNANNMAQNNEIYVDDDPEDDDIDKEDDDIYDAEEEEEEQFEDAPNNERLTGRRESRTMDHPSNSAEARAKRVERQKKHVRKESAKPPDLFGDNESDSEEYMDDDARAKRDERANKSRKESIATPDIYGDAQGESEEDGDDEEEDEEEDVNRTQPQATGTKRRGSQIYMNEEAMAKRQVRNNHRRGSSVATPNIFRDNYDPEKEARNKAQKYAPEAVTKRLQRKAKRVGAAAVKHVKSHRRKESLAEKLLLGPMDDADDIKSADPEQRKELQEKARKEQRRKSRQLIKSQVGAKEHFSDDDVELQEDKPQRAGLKARKKMKAAQRSSKQQADEDIETTQYTQANKKRGSIKADPMITSIVGDDEKNKRHRRDSSAPVIDLGFEDPDVLLHYEKLKVQDLEKELSDKLVELDEVKKERDIIKSQIDTQTTDASKAKEDSQIFERELNDAIHSKADLAQKCAMEIMRLTMILNTLQQMPKIREIVQLLMDESAKDNKNKNGSLLG